MLDQALRYAQHGLRVIPLCPNEKKPKVDQWSMRGSTDPNIITQWFQFFKAINIGILTGESVFVLDIDPRNDGNASFDRLCEEFGSLPETATVESGGGGRHYFFRIPSGERVAKRNDLLPGIDILGEKAYVVAAPSIHPLTAKPYVWSRDIECGFAEPPDWLMALLAKPREGRSNGRKVITKSCDAPRKIMEEPTNSSVQLCREADIPSLVERVISDYPVQATGTRNWLMRSLVASLAGQAYRREDIVLIGVSWWNHYLQLGTIRSPLSDAEQEINSTINSILRSDSFSQLGTVDHEAGYQAIVFDKEILRSIRVTEDLRLNFSHVLLSNINTNKNKKQNHKTVTEGRLLCGNDPETAFVEALVVHFTHKLRTAFDPRKGLNGTWKQLADIVKTRSGLTLWNPQLDRMMSKYITRPVNKPAKRAELLVQTKKGTRCLKSGAGTPSEFKLTGLLEILDLLELLKCDSTPPVAPMVRPDDSCVGG